MVAITYLRAITVTVEVAVEVKVVEYEGMHSYPSLVDWVQ